MKPGVWRVVAGVVVLLVLAALALALTPAYLKNLQFQNALVGVVQRAEDSKSPDAQVLDAVAGEAARLGLPVQAGNVHIRRAKQRLDVEVLYVVPVRLPLYSVDLHFRPRVASR